MKLNEYLVAGRRMIATTTQDAAMYTDDLLTEGLRQALREYEQYAAPLEYVATVIISGQRQDLAELLADQPELQELIFVAWPWDANPAGLRLRDRIVHWRTVAPGVIWIEGGEPRGR